MTREIEMSTDADREIVISRLIDAPREKIFRIWSDAKTIEPWWGPQGFTTTTQEFKFTPGGSWHFIMHGPDGRDYRNHICYTEIKPFELLKYSQGGDLDAQPAEFEAEIHFGDQAGKTLLTLRMIFPTAEAREHVVREYGAVEGGQQTLSRLAEYLAAF